jgi:DNA polymerase III alpha subunit
MRVAIECAGFTPGEADQLRRVLAAVRIRAKMAKNLTDGRRTGGAAVGCGFSDRKFDCLLPTIGL